MPSSSKRKSTRIEGVYVRETSSGQKVFDITYTRKGKKIWERVGSESDGYSLKDAQTIRAIRIKAIRHNEELPCDRSLVPTFDTVAQRYLEWSKATKRSWGDDHSRYRIHIAPAFANKKVDEIMPLDVERLSARLKAEGKAPATIKQCLAIFRAIFNKGIAWGMIQCPNPMKSVRMPKVDNARERFLHPEEVSLLLSELAKRSPQAYELAVMALNTGARRSELLNLRWSDVDLVGRMLTFRGTKSGKTRKIPINETVYALLSGKQRGSGSDAVFPSKDGLRCLHVTNTFQRVADRIFNGDLDRKDRRNRVVFHTLRHTAASYMVMSGAPLGTVKAILGHSSLAMVDRYSHLSENHKIETLRTLERDFERKRSIANILN